MRAIIDAALDRSRTTISALILILIAGAVAYSEIPKESDPDINIPIIYTSMTHEGISPQDAERLLLKPMEQEMRGVEGVKEMRSTAYQGGANVVVEFEAGFDADKALLDVREKVDTAKKNLPDETDDPTVNEVNLSLFPVLVVTLSGNVTERELLHMARDLRDEIEGIPGVLEGKLSGHREELAEIVINPVALEGYGLDATAVLNFANRSNRLIAAGTLDTGTGRFPIKVPGLYESVNDILDQPIKAKRNTTVRVRDVAFVRRSFKDRNSYARLNGHPAIAIEVSKRIGENIIDINNKVREVVEDTVRTFPDGVDVTFSKDKSSQIHTMLGDLQNNVLAAILLVMIVVVGALGIRSAGLVGVAIPGSFLLGILVLSTLGLTVNIVVLFSLILATGMLVDGAIVVTEFADRKLAEGLPKKQAYGEAAKRMSWPIIASTATTLAAFMPLIFWPGIVGEFMKFLPITLVATLSASLLMALVFVPTLGGIIGKASTTDPEAARALSLDKHGDLSAVKGFTGAYLKVLGLALKAPGFIIILAVSSLIGIQVIYGTFGKGVEFFPDVERENALIHVHARGNLATDEKLALVKEVEDVVLQLDEFKSVYTVIGSTGGGGSDIAEDVIGTINLEYKDWWERRKSKVILADIKDRTSGFAGIIIEAVEEEAGPPTGKPVQIQLTSRFADEIEEATEIVRDKFESMEGLRDIEDDRPIPGIEWRLEVDRVEAAKFDIDIALIGSYVKLVTNGLKITDYRPEDSDEEIDIVVRFPDAYRQIRQLDRIRIQTNKGLVPVGHFIQRIPKPQVGKVKRVDARRAMTVKADVLEGVLPDEKVKELRIWLETAKLPENVNVTFKGEDEEQNAAKEFLTRAFGVALFVMAIILVTQFNSFYSALLILSAVIMSTIGVMIGLLITGKPFGIVMSGIGVIALAGIVVNNNIVLIDTYDNLKKRSGDARDAIMRTGAQRLRPVMLTTITTILGLLPMVMQVNIDFFTRQVSVGAPSTQWWVSLSTAIVFGLSFATVLTLIVTPSALLFKENVANWFNRKKEKKTHDETSLDEVEIGTASADD